MKSTLISFVQLKKHPDEKNTEQKMVERGFGRPKFFFIESVGVDVFIQTLMGSRKKFIDKKQEVVGSVGAFLLLPKQAHNISINCEGTSRRNTSLIVFLLSVKRLADESLHKKLVGGRRGKLSLTISGGICQVVALGSSC